MIFLTPRETQVQIPKPVILNEHGAWAVLLIQMIVVASIAGTLSVPLLLLTLSALCVFYVHMKLRATSSRKSELTLSDKLSMGKLNVVYHVAVVQY